MALKPSFLFPAFQPYLLPHPHHCLFFFSHPSFVAILRQSSFRSFSHGVSSTWNALLLTVSWLPFPLFSCYCTQVASIRKAFLNQSVLRSIHTSQVAPPLPALSYYCFFICFVYFSLLAISSP